MNTRSNVTLDNVTSRRLLTNMLLLWRCYSYRMDGCTPRLTGRSTLRRPRGRLVRSERVCESSNSHPLFCSWDIFIRDSLLQIAWPMSLSSDADHLTASLNGHVKYRSVDTCCYFCPFVLVVLHLFTYVCFTIFFVIYIYDCLYVEYDNIRLYKIIFHRITLYTFGHRHKNT